MLYALEDFFRFIFTVSPVIQPRSFFFGHKGAKSNCCNRTDEDLCLSNGAAFKTLVLYAVCFLICKFCILLTWWPNYCWCSGIYAWPPVLSSDRDWQSNGRLFFWSSSSTTKHNVKTNSRFKTQTTFFLLHPGLLAEAEGDVQSSCYLCSSSFGIVY